MKRSARTWTLLVATLVTGFSPLAAQDTDGDGFFDSAENEIGTDPNDPLSRPFMEISATPIATVYRPSSNDKLIAPPIVNAYRSGQSALTANGAADVIGTPAIFLKACDADFDVALDPFVPHDVSSEAEWHLETVLGESGAFINGLDGTVASNDWLIGPAKSVPVGETLSLTFDYFQSGSDSLGNGLRVLISTNYAGGAPPDGTWADLTPPDLTSGPADSWQRISGITIQGYEGANVRIAFQYLSSGNTVGNSYRVGIDNICLHQNIFFPPEITGFTADGTEITDNRIFTSNPDLQVVANNLARVGFGEFAYRPVGATEWTTLGEDTRTANGLAATWPITTIPDGDYELTARLWNGPNFTERTHPVTVALDPPPTPSITNPATGLITEAPSVTVRVAGEAGATIVLLRNGVAIESDYSDGSALIYTVPLPLGMSNFTALAQNRAGASPPSAVVAVTRERRTPILSLTLNSTTVEEGSTVSGTVSLDEAQLQDTLVTLSSSRAAQVNPGPAVTIPAGQLSAPILLTGTEDSTLEPLYTVGITASAIGIAPVTTTILAADNDIPILTLEIDRASISESDGANAAIATVTRDLSGLPLTVTITNSNPTEVLSPSQVSFSAGQTSLSFPLGAIDDLAVDGTQSADLKALVISQGQTLSQSPTASLDVLDNESPAIVLQILEGYVLEGGTGRLRVERVGSATDQPLEVTLVGNDNEELVVPASITIPAGAAHVIATLTGPVDLDVEDTSTVLVTASAAGHTSGQLPVTVIDQTLADLVVRDLVAPLEAETEQSFQVTYRIRNQGLLSTTLPFVQRVLLSTDPLPDDNDEVLTQVTSPPGNLAPGDDYGRNLNVQAPQQAGTYYLFVVTDATDVVDEISESNNSATLAGTLTVLPAYTATVSADPPLVAVNNPVTFSGAARNSNNSPAPFKSVNIHIRVGVTERIISAITNAVGTYSVTWNPLPGEGGEYEVGAVHPGVRTAPTQDTFSIITFDADFPSSVLHLTEGGGLAEEGTIANPTTIDLTNIALVAVDAPAGLTVTPTLPGNELAPGAIWTVPLQIDADPGLTGNHIVTLRLTSDEGIELEHQLLIAVRALFPNLVISPNTLACSVVRGTQKVVTFNIENTGGAESGPIDILLPPLAWLNLATPSPLPSLAPGASTGVTLLLNPSSTLALGLNEGSLVVQPAAGDGKSIPYAFRVVSDLKGDLEVCVVDELFYFTAAAPKVAGANVVISDAVSAQQIASITTAADGLAIFNNLVEGWYRVTVDSPEHTARTQLVYASAGELTQLQLFISKQLVTFTWTVNEIEINDTYTISVESTFQTNVPAPVVTITPGVIDVMDLTNLGATKVVNLTVENHGLIATQTGSFSFGTHPFYEITPLIQVLGTLPAKTSLIVPVTIRRIGVFGPDGHIVSINNPPAPAVKPPHAGHGIAAVACGISASFSYSYPCGDNDVQKNVPIAISGVSGHCPGGWGSGGGGGGGGGGSFGGSGAGSTGSGISGFATGVGTGVPKSPLPIFTPITFPTPTVCDCPFFDELCLSAEKKFEIDSLGQKLAGSLSKVLPPWITITGVTVTANAGGSICVCCVDGQYGTSGNATASASVTVDLLVGFAAGGEFSSSAAGWKDVSASVNAMAGIETSITGTVSAGFTKECLGPVDFCISGSLSASAFAGIDLTGTASGTKIGTGGDPDVTYSGTATGTFGISGSANVSVTGCTSGNVEFTACASFTPVAELSLQLTETGGGASTSIGGAIEYVPFEVGCEPAPAPGHAPPPKSKDGMGKIPRKDQHGGPVVDSFPAAQFVRPDGQILAEEFPQLFANQGVCASVRIRIDQEAVMTRSAFRAELELGNEVPDDSLTGVGFVIDVRDENGLPAGDNFNIRVTQLQNLNAIDGTGTIGPAQAGSAQWTLIPRDTAAPTEDTIYTVGGTITYNQGGSLFTIPVEPVQITVRPDASLFLKYFHQRDVYSDDPFTPRTEPSVPYALAVLVDNQGAGDARNLTITSAQPEIIDNEKGLLIDFEIIASQVAGQAAAPSLAANFGDIPAGESKVATWFLTSSLQGQFVDYDASFEHVDSLGDPRISLLKEVEIFEMIHMVQGLGAKDDGLPDFLTNDVSDFNDYPDTVHLSDGGTAPVTVFELASATPTTLPNGNLEVQLSTGLGTGWSYLRIPDPGSGMHLIGAIRSDGLDMMVNTNVWTTDRTFDVFGSRPVYEDILHLVDCDSTGSFTLTYEPLPGVDVVAPSSSISPLPLSSGLSIPLRWSGTDDTAIDSFDIYFRENNGPWELHLEATHRTSAIFLGTLGNSYGFYSIARDPTGNIEAAPAGPDATTTVDVLNLPPVLADLPDRSVNEGSIFSTVASATDPDGPSGDIIYSITQGPPGIQIDPFTGFMDLVTAEGDGGSQITVTVVATDSGIPSESVRDTFTITIASTNSPPSIATVAPQTVEVGEPLVLQIVATDTDIPMQSLVYTLGNAPDGMSIDPTSGLLVWTPAEVDADATFLATVIAQDDGQPQLQTSRLFTISVPALPIGPPVFNPPLTPRLVTTPGLKQITISAPDPDGDPVTITANLAGLPGNPIFTGVPGSAAGTLSWDLTGVSAGIYLLPLTATTTGGEITNGILQIRVEAGNDYWDWASIALFGVMDPADYGMFSNPDGDPNINIFEMIFLLNPLAYDQIVTNYGYGGPVDVDTALFLLDFNLHAGADQFASISFQEFVNQAWQTIDPGDFTTVLDPNGDLDGDPSTLDVQYQFTGPALQFEPNGIYQLSVDLLPGIGP